jgi:hypothetical protein
MLPVAIAMLGTRARPPTLGFLGWFDGTEAPAPTLLLSMQSDS